MIDSYETLPLGIYEKCLDCQGDENEVTLEVLSLLSGHTVDELMTMPIDGYFAIKAQGAFLLYQPTAGKVQERYKCGEFTLRPIKGVKDITTAQFIDFQEWSKQPGRNTAEKLACFLTPEGRDYGEGYDQEDVINAVREHLSVADAITLDAFFFYASLKSMHASLASLERRLTPRERLTRPARKMRQALRALRRSGAGWRRWTPLLSLPATLGGRFTESE